MDNHFTLYARMDVLELVFVCANEVVFQHLTAPPLAGLQFLELSNPEITETGGWTYPTVASFGESA